MTKIVRVIIEFDADGMTSGDILQTIDAILFNALPTKLHGRGIKTETVEPGGSRGRLT